MDVQELNNLAQELANNIHKQIAEFVDKTGFMPMVAIQYNKFSSGNVGFNVKIDLNIGTTKP